ncbi:MAG: hypothetical protein V4596_09140 [Bdellovibrionota bacterium]
MGKNIFFIFIILFQISVLAEELKFDRGPDPQDPMQKELIEIIQDMPFLPGISEQLQVLVPSQKGQKMRPDFGAMPLRGFLTPNSISVLVIGQDGTHIAEGANRPGIAGFGGRVHDMLMHFGIYESVFFTNLYVNTISGQYGSRSTPVVKDGKSIQYLNVIENRQWLMTHDGLYGKWRNRFLSWVIRNNLDSLKMVMMLGQAGKDAGANLVNHLGGKVTARPSVGTGEQYNVPVFKMVGAGGNNEWAVPLTKDGEDVAQVLIQNPKILSTFKDSLNKKLKELEEQETSKTIQSQIKILKKRILALEKPFDYRDADRETGEGISTTNAKELLVANVEAATQLMVFTRGGPQKNGVLYPEQFGGWDLETMEVNGKKTRSIQGLRIPCDGSQAGVCADAEYVIAPDVVFVGAPHPTALSMGEMTRKGSAAKSVEKELLTPLKEEQSRGWVPPAPEKNLNSRFLEGKPYSYGRGIIPPSHGDPGITDMRLLPVSTAQRSGSSTIVIGTRDRAQFSKEKLKEMEKATPSNEDLVNSHNVLTSRPKFESWLFKYDRGPDSRYAKLLFETLDKKSVLWVKAQYNEEAQGILKEKLKADMSPDEQDDVYLKTVGIMFDKYGIDAFNFKSHPEAGFFGHYRGTFENPRVVILADPHGYDSFITSKAATGERGQYLNGLMSDLGVGSDYLVISTVPMMMDGATNEEWSGVLESTQNYRDQLFKEILSQGTPDLLIADGPNAAKELKRMGYDFVTIESNGKADSGFKEAGLKIAQRKAFANASEISGARVDIPREHLTWIARVWEGTSGDRVITADDKENKGKAFAIVAPNWARFAEVHFTKEEQATISELVNRLTLSGEPLPGEKISDYVERRSTCISLAEYKEQKGKKKCELNSPLQFLGVLKDAGSF